MLLLLTVTLPVFLVLGFGYLAAWRGWIGENAIDGVMKFSQSFAIPCLLFLAIARLDLGQEFDLTLLGSFYAGALAGFFAAGEFGPVGDRSFLHGHTASMVLLRPPRKGETA